MSIGYFGVPTSDPRMVGPIIEGSAKDVPAIDGAAIRAALRRVGLAGDDRSTLKWEGEGSYVFVDVGPHHVEITHGTGGGDVQLEIVMDTIFTLQQQGLKVWDPQQGSWFPG